MKPKTSQNDCFVVFPSTGSLYATQISFQNLLRQLKEKDPAAAGEVFYWQIENKLTVKISTNKKFELYYNEDPAIQQGNNYFSIYVGLTTISKWIERFSNLLNWLMKFDRQKYRAVVNVTDHRLRIDIHEKESKAQAMNVLRKQEKLLLIDGSNMLHIGYFATRTNAFKNSDGIYTNGVFTFVRMFLNIMKQLQPTHLAVCWDKEDGCLFRKALYPYYKANRKKKEEDLIHQLQMTKGLLKQMNVQQFESETYEADDLIGTISQKWSNEKKKPCYIVSNDRDLYQLIDRNIAQVSLKKGRANLIGLKQFERKYGILPQNWIDVKGILGDKSDHIPGVKGVGEKACFPLIQQYGTIEMLYRKLDELQEGEFKRYYLSFLNGKEEAFLSKTLATIVTNVPEVVNVDVESLKLNINKKAMIREFQKLQFKSLLKQIQQGAYRVS